MRSEESQQWWWVRIQESRRLGQEVFSRQGLEASSPLPLEVGALRLLPALQILRECIPAPYVLPPRCGLWGPPRQARLLSAVSRGQAAGPALPTHSDTEGSHGVTEEMAIWPQKRRGLGTEVRHGSQPQSVRSSKPESAGHWHSPALSVSQVLCC